MRLQTIFNQVGLSADGQPAAVVDEVKVAATSQDTYVLAQRGQAPRDERMGDSAGASHLAQFESEVMSRSVPSRSVAAITEAEALRRQQAYAARRRVWAEAVGRPYKGDEDRRPPPGEVDAGPEE